MLTRRVRISVVDLAFVFACHSERSEESPYWPLLLPVPAFACSYFCLFLLLPVPAFACSYFCLFLLLPVPAFAFN
jgi:hypothetical protein